MILFQTTLTLLQQVWDLLGYWRVFIPHLAQVLKPLDHWYKRVSGGTGMRHVHLLIYHCETGSQGHARLECSGPIKALQADVHVTKDGVMAGVCSSSLRELY